MRRCVVTGGAGFIGSHLTEALLARGDEVRAIDDLSTGSLRNLTKVLGHTSLRFVEGCCSDPAVLDPLVEGADCVFHLAAAVGVQLVINEPVRTIRTNIRGTETVLEATARHGAKVFLASTSEVYGKGFKVPQSETDDLLLGPTTCPRWSYACSKAVDEFLALAFVKERGVRAVIGRFFNTVGPRQTGRYGMVIPRFIEQAKRGEPLTVHGDGSQSRCFGHVRDVVRAVVELMEKPGAAGEVFNIGSDREVSILDLARRVIEFAGSDSAIRLIPYGEAFGPGFEDMMRRVPDLTKLRSTIDWTDLRGLDEIIKDAMEEPGGAAAE